MKQPDLASILETCRQLMAQAELEIERLRAENRDLLTTLENVRSDLATANAHLRLYQSSTGDSL